MFEWSEELKMVRDAVRTFVDTEIRPHREELEHGDLPPYDLLRKLSRTFGKPWTTPRKTRIGASRTTLIALMRTRSADPKCSKFTGTP